MNTAVMSQLDPSLWGLGEDSNATTKRVTGASANSWKMPGLCAADYHANRDVLSSSLLKDLLVSPAHFKSSLETYRIATPNMDFGTLVHGLVLEPTSTSHLAAVYPGVKSRTKEYREFEDAHADRLVVDLPTYQRALNLAEKIKSRSIKGRPFEKFIEEGEVESSIYFTEPTTGIELKVRFDLLHPEFSFDLKTTRHHRVDSFVRDACDLNYDLSAYMYSLGRCLFDGTESPKPFIFVAACTDETSSPVHVLEVGSSFLANGAKKFQETVSLFRACSDADYWPDGGEDQVLEITPWQEYKPARAWIMPGA